MSLLRSLSQTSSNASRANGSAGRAQRGVDALVQPAFQRYGHREAHAHWTVHRAELEGGVVVPRYAQIHRAVRGRGIQPGAVPLDAVQPDAHGAVVTSD